MGKDGSWPESESVSSARQGGSQDTGHAPCADKGAVVMVEARCGPEHCHLPPDLAVRPGEALLPWNSRHCGRRVRTSGPVP